MKCHIIVNVIPNNKNSLAGIKMKIWLSESRACICGDVVIHACREQMVVLTCSAWCTATFLCQGKQECKRRNFQKPSVVTSYLKNAREWTHQFTVFFTHISRDGKNCFSGELIVVLVVVALMTYHLYRHETK
jgi:hypothetical protein